MGGVRADSSADWNEMTALRNRLIRSVLSARPASSSLAAQQRQQTSTPELEGCRWKFSPENVDGFEGDNLAPYTRVVWPANLDDLTPCTEDA